MGNNNLKRFEHWERRQEERRKDRRRKRQTQTDNPPDTNLPDRQRKAPDR